MTPWRRGGPVSGDAPPRAKGHERGQNAFVYFFKWFFSSPHSPSRTLMLRSHLDARDARSGLVVSDKHGYYDSQNIVRGGDAPGCYSVILHHCFGHEGGGGLRLYSSFTEDGGRTWSDLVAVEPSLTRVSNDGYQLVHPQDPSRVFVFYSHVSTTVHS